MRNKPQAVLLNEQKIKSGVPDFLGEIVVLDQIESTNDYFKDPKKRHEKPSVCIAEMQTKGRGRFDRLWHSPHFENVYFSLCYRFKKTVQALSGLSLIIGLAVCKTIETIIQLPDILFIKWPNDILIDEKKIAGILVEIAATS